MVQIQMNVLLKLRERTDVIIAGNHDWAAVGKIDLEDFSEAARISAEWTAAQLTEENRTFLANLPERIEKGDFLLVHGSPYGPLWEYLTSEVLAETKLSAIYKPLLPGWTYPCPNHLFQQPDTVANAPTRPLAAEETLELLETHQRRPLQKHDVKAQDEVEPAAALAADEDEDKKTESMLAVHPTKHMSNGTEQVATMPQ